MKTVQESQKHSEERHILERGLEIIRDRTGLPVVVQAEDLTISSNNQIDAYILLRAGKVDFPFLVEVKKVVSQKDQIQRLLSNSKTIFPAPWMLIAESVSPSMRVVLKNLEVGFVDLAGHISLPLRIENIADMKEHGESEKLYSEKKTYKPRLHSESTMRLAFYLLSDPKNLQMTQRSLADLVGISPGMINRCLGSLEELGFLAKKENGEKLIRRRDELVSRWAMLYADQYKEHLYIGRFKRVDNEPKNFFITTASGETVRSPHCVWGGEAAGSRYTRHLDPGVFTIYVRDSHEELLAKMRLSPSEQGDVLLYKTFWNPAYDSKSISTQPHTNYKDVAPPLVVYADLLGSGFERNREVARMIYDQNHIGD